MSKYAQVWSFIACPPTYFCHRPPYLALQIIAQLYIMVLTLSFYVYLKKCWNCILDSPFSPFSLPNLFSLVSEFLVHFSRSLHTLKVPWSPDSSSHSSNPCNNNVILHINFKFNTYKKHSPNLCIHIIFMGFLKVCPILYRYLNSYPLLTWGGAVQSRFKLGTESSPSGRLYIWSLTFSACPLESKHFIHYKFTVETPP